MKNLPAPTQVIVEFHAGYKGGETPRRVIFGTKIVNFYGVVFRRRILDSSTRDVHEEFEGFIEGRRVRLRVRSTGEAEIEYLEET